MPQPNPVAKKASVAAREVSLQITTPKTIAKTMNMNDTISRRLFDFI